MSRITWRHIAVAVAVVVIGAALGVGLIMLINPIADQERSTEAPTTAAVALPAAAAVVTPTRPPGIEIALNPQDQAFVDGLKARGLDANTATPNFARAQCAAQEAIAHLGDGIGTPSLARQEAGAAIVYQSFLDQASISYKDPEQAKLFTDSTIATYCDDLAWIELPQP